MGIKAVVSVDTVPIIWNALQKAGIPVATETDGSRWVSFDWVAEFIRAKVGPIEIDLVVEENPNAA